MNKFRQFRALLVKNYLLQIRSRFLFLGWAGLLFQIVLPVAFFAVMLIPKALYKPEHWSMQQRRYADLDAKDWGSFKPYTGAGYARNSTAHVILTPNSTAVSRVARILAQAAACPKTTPKAKRRAGWGNFYSFFRVEIPDPKCQVYSSCLSSPQCYAPLLEDQIRVMESEEAAVQLSLTQPDTVDAIVAFQSEDLLTYKLRLNHSEVPSPLEVYHLMEPLPPMGYQHYWFFVNLQHLVNRALLGLHATNGSQPADVSFKYKMFPWPAVNLEWTGQQLSRAFATIALVLLLVFSFFIPSRLVVASIVHEKELRLREGMRILGLQELAYWASWALTHWTVMAASGLLAAIVGKLVYTHSSIIVMAAFYWLLALSLVSFSYLVSTFFTASRVAGTAQMLIYTVAMIPGFLLHDLRPYGSSSWYLACLLPPSAASLFGWLVLHLEMGGQGATFSTFTTSLTYSYPFSVATVFAFLLLDVFLYGALAWYFDKVLPGEGPRYPPWFIFQARYWREKLDLDEPSTSGVAASDEGSELMDALLEPQVDQDAEPSSVAVRVVNLQKVFSSAAGARTVAVDDISLDIERGKITALLGHNGAGKTTTISILTGILRPTSGTAFINGQNILHHMHTIRQSLGICPQFDLLWPNLTVKEHLQMYADIKGLPEEEVQQQVLAAVEEVGLTEKLDTVAGDLSGGQRRKLSVAIAFLGHPSVVFLDEPTSGMDPYSRRFTWDVIRKRRHDTAIILTTHSMEEADILCDTIYIMSEGKIAASGTSLELKAQYGMGYTLTLVTSAVPQQQQSQQPQLSGTHLEGDTPFIAGGLTAQAQHKVVELVTQHVPSAQLLTAAGAELSLRLPQEESQLFPGMLRELQQRKQELGISGYGLSMTTLEEVFLRVTSESARQGAGLDGISAASLLDGYGGNNQQDSADHTDLQAASQGSSAQATNKPRVRGLRLALQRWRALFLKRVLSARRDRLAVLTQLAVPLLLVYVSIWVSRFSVSVLNSSPLHLTRSHCLLGARTALSVNDTVRLKSGSDLEALLNAWPRSNAYDTGLNRTWTNIFRPPANDSLDGLLLKLWHSGHTFYDAVHIDYPLPSAGSLVAGSPITLFMMTNATATAAIPTLVSQASSALLRYMLSVSNASNFHHKPGHEAPSIHTYSHPLPVLPWEQKAQASKQASSLVLVMCFASFGAVLSASFVVFLVREVDSNSKHVQLVSGTPGLLFWLGNYTADLILYSIPGSCTVLLLLAFHQEPFKGQQLAAVAALVAMFGACSLPLTYLLHFPFKDEMLALQRLNQLFFVTGYLGFIVTLIFDSVDAVFGLDPWAKTTNAIVKGSLAFASPHYSFIQGIFDVTQTSPMYTRFQPRRHKVQSPWDWEAYGRASARLGSQGVMYAFLLLAVDLGWLQLWGLWLWRGVRKISGLQHISLKRGGADPAAGPLLVEVPLSPTPGNRTDSLADGQVAPPPRGRLDTSMDSAASTPTAGLAESVFVSMEEEEDVDVRQERLALQAGADTTRFKVLLCGVEKSYWLGLLRPRTHAVRGLWLGIPAGECFGLLGVNGAGKTSTFRMLTGELQPDSGEVYVCGHSVLEEVWAVRAQLGYCPQFSGLPLALTGEEVLYMYARIRGIPEHQIKPLVTGLLSRLGLSKYAKLECGAYSGGNKRKLAVAVAIVGDPSVVLMDEPSTGMDPGARRFLWGLLQKEVIGRGRTVVLTSHSMEECEALSTRIGIMVGGRFRCLGTTQHLKNRFGAGYSIELSLLDSSQVSQDEVIRALQADCPHAVLSEAEPGRLCFNIPQQHADLADIFSAIEFHREELGIRDYSLSQTTLEQVFVALASSQQAQHA